jgi:hypothetical protein
MLETFAKALAYTLAAYASLGLVFAVAVNYSTTVEDPAAQTTSLQREVLGRK